MQISLIRFKTRKTIAAVNLGLLLLLLCAVALPAASAPQIVGKISFARGSNAAQQPGAAPRILGKDAEIFQGDNIQTAERSFVIIEFIDGAKVTVRPNSNFSIDQYPSQSASAQAKLSLHQGGIRSQSGEIAKQNPENFQIQTELATVKAQQADYSVRICHDQDCRPEQESSEPSQQPLPAKTEASVVARIADIKGEVYVTNQADNNAKQRRLSLGAPLYSEDYLRSAKDSYALMVFRDGEKITLQADSELAIADYHYQQQGGKNHALYRLTTGGMRVLTGSIGKTNKEAFAIDTPVGTIGIRGTGFDLSCVGSCVNPQAHDPNLRQELTNGLYSHVWQGQIAIVNDAGEFLLTVPDSNYVANRNSEAIDLKGLPEQLFNNPFPRPDIDRSNLQRLFSAIHHKGIPAGLYVDVHQGHVQLYKHSGISEDNKIDLGKNEVAHADQQHLVRLDQQEKFQQQDPYLLPDVKDNQQHHGIYSELADDDGINPGNGYQCTNE